jgi:DNA polymerase I-like protein with 3'-5' exonuclease and polymerase domains
MILTLDFETYYDKEYSLKKMTTEEYIRSDQFKAHGVGVKSGDQPSAYIWSEIPLFLKSIDWSTAFVLCHNTRFDGAILAWRYGIRPKFLLDTLSMARAVFPHESGSLANLSKLCGLGEKGHDLESFMGKRDLTEEEQVRLGLYCMNDVDLTYRLFQTMKANFPPSELRIVDQTLRMFTEPVLELDTTVLYNHLQKIQAKQEKLLAGRDLTSLRSNPQFAKQLVALGVEPPKKISLTTGKETFAFAKTDEGMTALLEHENEEVQLLAAARLGVKSSIEESRTKAFLGIAERGSLPVPLNYFGAQNTGRFGGSDGLNLQNLPRGGELRKSIVAPEGHVLVVSDFSSIEARMIARLAGQEDLLEQFRGGADIYCEFASRVYGRKITKEDKKERFLGKVCLAEGTMVLCKCGWKCIETITSEDELWDGENWVTHRGLLNNGIAQTLNLCGLWLTPDHLLWSGAKWVPAQLAAQDADTLFLILGTGAENLPSSGVFWEYEAEFDRSSLGAIAKMRNTQSVSKTSEHSKAPDATCAPSSPGRQSGIGSTQTRYQTTSTGGGFSIGWLRRLLGATPRAQKAKRISTTGAEGSPFMKSGERTERCFFDIFKPLMDGITRFWRWIGSTQMETTNQGTFGSPRDERTFATNEKLQTSKRLSQVYDIACAGPKNRFTVLTQRGPVLVHNCILALGYSMGWKKLATMMAVGPLGQEPILFSKGDLDAMGGFLRLELDYEGITQKIAGVALQVHCSAAKHLVDSYREFYDRIPRYWKTCERILDAMHRGVQHQFGVLSTEKARLLLPNGLYLSYKGLHRDEEGSWRYFGKRGERQYLYSGKLAENVTQALSRIVMTDAMLKVGERYKVALTVHDELVCVVPEDEAEAALDYMLDCMSVAPEWCPDLPVAAEGATGKSYEEAK